MLTYAVVIAAVVIVLYVSFRALGGGDPVAAEDYRGLLTRLLGYAAGRADQVDAALALPAASVAAENGRKPLDPLVEAATEARKALSGYQQQLARIETEAGGDERETLLGARTLLSAAIEDYGWACRMVEAGGYRDNSGVRDAVDVLRRHARDCMTASEALVAPVEQA